MFVFFMLFVFLSVIVASILGIKYWQNRNAEFKFAYEYNKGKAKELQKQEEEQVRVVQNISHEIKGQISLVKLNLDFVLDSMKNEKKLSSQEGLFSRLKKSIDMLTYYSSNLLDMSRPRNQRQYLKFSIYDLYSVIKKVSDLYPNILFHYDDKSTRQVEIDEFKIIQVLSNIIHNAVKYSSREHKVRIAVKEIEQDQVLITISDLGIGIPKEDIDRVFDPYCVSTKTFGLSSGTGLGLSLCKEIISGHNGEIFVKNNEGKVGTSFSIRLPISQKNI